MFMTIGTFINIKSFGRYKVSADGGKTWTIQWLTGKEVEEHINKGYLIEDCYYTKMK